VPASPANGSDGAAGAAGADGAISLTLNGTVSGSVNLDAGNGNINTTINSGGSVGGTITANAAANSTLTFNMQTTSPQEYAQALADLGLATASGGNFTFQGQTYSWVGFDDLVNQIGLLAQQVQEVQEKLCTGSWRLNYANCDAPTSIHSVDGSLWINNAAGARIFTYDLSSLPEPGETRNLLYSTWTAVDGEILGAYLYLLPNGNLQVVVGSYIYTWAPGSLDYGL
jgi:hypothetical protein